MNNFIQNGERITWTNNTGSGVSSGDVVELTDCIAVAVTDIAAGAAGALQLTGVFQLAANAGESWTAGKKLYWDGTNDRLTITETSNIPAGHALENKTSTTSEKVRLQPF